MNIKFWRGIRAFGVCVLLAALLGGCAQKGEDAQVRPMQRDGFQRITDQTVAEHEIGGMRQRIYRIEDNRFGSAFEYDGMTYLLGESIDEHMELSQTPLTFEGSAVYSWVEARGAAYACTRLMAVVEGEPIFLIDFDGPVEYEDFDGDSTPELIVSGAGSLPPTLSIAFWQAGDVRVLDVNAALKAYGAWYQDGRIHTQPKQDSAEPVAYRFDGEKFIKLK